MLATVSLREISAVSYPSAQAGCVPVIVSTAAPLSANHSPMQMATYGPHDGHSHGGHWHGHSQSHLADASDCVLEVAAMLVAPGSPDHDGAVALASLECTGMLKGPDLIAAASSYGSGCV